MTGPPVTFVVESGTDVRLVEGLAARCSLRVLARRIPGGVEVSREPREPVDTWTGPASRGRFARAAFSRLRSLSAADRVIVQGYGPAALAANLAAQVTGARTIMLVCSPVERYYECRRHAADAGRPYRVYELALIRLFARLNARVGREYIVLSRHLEQVVRSHGARGPVGVIPVYGVDGDVFRPATNSKDAIRRERKLPPGGKLIFFSSRIAPEKDPHTLLAAVRRLVEAGRDIRLLHRSGGFRAMIGAAEAAGIRDRVIATDAVHPERELPRDYQASDLCVQASKAEGLGFSPLESLACEVPVVAADVGGLRETIVDGSTGWTYPPGDAAALAGAIADALDHPDEAARRARAGRAMVLERFERGSVFDRLMAELERT